MKYIFFLVILCIKVDFIYSQCTPPAGTGSSCTTNGGIAAISQTPGVTGQIWYTSATGTGTITPSTSGPGGAGVWVSTLNINSSVDKIYYVATVCGTSISSRTEIKFLPNGGPFYISPSSDPSTLCQTDIGTFFLTGAGGTPSTYQWRLNSLTSTVLGTGVTYTPTTPGKYYLTSTVCGNSKSVSIDVSFRSPVTTISEISGTTARFRGAAKVVYTASAPNATSYLWSLSPASSGTMIPGGEVIWNPAFTGNATVSVTAYGCGGSSISISKVVTVLEYYVCPPPQVVSYSGCPISTTLVAVSQGPNSQSNKWYTTGQNTATPTTNGPRSNAILISTMNVSGTSKLTYYVATMCTVNESDRVAVTYTPIDKNLSITPSSSPGSVCSSQIGIFSLTASGGDVGMPYEWRFGSATAEVISTLDKIFPTKSGLYYLTGSACGVKKTATIMVTVASCAVNSAIQEVEDGEANKDLNEVSVFPNPWITGSTIKYSLEEDNVVTLQVFDNQGRMVKSLLNSVSQKAGNYEEDLLLKTLSVKYKMLIVKLSINDKVFVKKIISE